jgi:hypothetical protein
VREMGDVRRKLEKKVRKKKCVNHVREKGKTKLVSELVSKYYSE